MQEPGASHTDHLASGYYGINQQLNNREKVRIVMIPTGEFKYNEAKVLPFRIEDNVESTSAENITKKDFVLGRSKIDRALSGQVAGLQMTAGSGMPGEGSYMNLRGVRSFIGNNAPLVVINGVPYIPDNHDSQLINGLSRDIFQAYNIDDIQNITVLKGARQPCTVRWVPTVSSSSRPSVVKKERQTCRSSERDRQGGVEAAREV